MKMYPFTLLESSIISFSLKYTTGCYAITIDKIRGTITMAIKIVDVKKKERESNFVYHWNLAVGSPRIV